MCITSSRSILDNTYIGAWDINHPTFGYRHVLAYQNRVKNLAKGPNCMLLHIQSKEEIKPEWIIDTSYAPTFLTAIYDEIDPIPKNDGIAWMSSPTERPNYVIERGVYNIAILNNLSPEIIDATLKQIPTHKLPSLENGLIQFFKDKFPNFPLLLCCFDNKDAQQASPILIHFPPLFPEKLMLNTIDSHGGIPDTEKKVGFHQKLIVGSYKCKNKLGIKLYKYFSEHLYQALEEFLPKFATVTDLLHFFNGPNKDICVDVKNIHENKLPKVYLNILGNIESQQEVEVVQTGNTFSLRRLIK